MSATTASGRSGGHQRARLAGRPHDGLVGLQRALARGEDVVLGRGRERACPRPRRRPPSASRSAATTSWPRAHERAPERDERERVARVAEGAQQQPQRDGQAAGKLGDQAQLLEALLPRPTPSA